ncbi:MAG: hypothetical protein AAFO91_20110, partial [Bacteroidota bacterium]
LIQQRQAMGMVEGDFAICLSLYHGLELLLHHGLKSFHIFIRASVDASKGGARARVMLQSNAEFGEIMRELEALFGENPDSVVRFTQPTQYQPTQVGIVNALSCRAGFPILCQYDK